MTPLFRSTTPQDAPHVTAFLQRIFELHPNSPLIAPKHLHWKCWEEHPAWPGSRGYIIADDGNLVAHATVVPLSCRIESQHLKMVHLIDWAADTSAVGSGVRLLLGIARLVDGIVVAGGSEMTQKILPALGFKVLGEVENYVRPLRPLSRLSGQPPGLGVLARTGRSLLWQLKAPSVPTRGWLARRILPADLGTATIRWPLARPGIAFFERSNDVAAYILKCPATPMELYSVSRHGNELGYFLLAHAPGQTRLVDFFVNADQPEAWSALVQLAVLQARRGPAAELAAAASDPISRQALLACGFHGRGTASLRLLLKKGVSLPKAAFRFQMIDSDAAYLHDNKPEYWA